MNTFWLKIAGLAVLIVCVIVLIAYFSGSETGPTAETESKPGTYWEQVEKDREEFLTEPEPIDSTEQKPQMPETAGQIQKQIEKVTLYFVELSDIDKIEAERLLSTAVPGRSIGRLPTMGYKLMVESCRQIIQRFPGSWYAYRAKQMLADIPSHEQERYNITEEERDLSKFAQPRRGTKPFIVEESR